MEIPVTLKHKPVIAVENYENVDGREAYESEAKGLSLGLAQWNDRGRVEASAKIWRYTGGKWSRQSEELPLHRVFDLAILLARSLKYFREEGYRYEKLYKEDDALIDRIGIQGDAMSLEVVLRNPNIDEDIRLLLAAIEKDGEILGERMSVLAAELADMGFKGGDKNGDK